MTEGRVSKPKLKQRAARVPEPRALLPRAAHGDAPAPREDAQGAAASRDPCDANAVVASRDPEESSDSESELLAELAKLRKREKSQWRTRRAQPAKRQEPGKINDTARNAKHRDFINKFVK